MHKITTSMAGGAAVCLLLAVGTGATAGAAWPGANGRILFESTRNGAVNVFTVDPDAPAAVAQVSSSADRDETPAGSPSGQLVTFRSNRDTGNNQGWIYVAPALQVLAGATDPDSAVQLTSAAGDDKDPAFVTDGTVIYSHLGDGETAYQLYTVPVAAPHTPQPVFPAPTGCNDTEPAVSAADTDLVAFTRTCAAAASHVWVLDRSLPVSPTNPVDVTAANGAAYPVTTDTEPDWAPNGTRIALVGTGSIFGSKSQLYSVNPDGTDRRPFWGDGDPGWAGTGFNDRSPAYSPDGTRLAFSRGQIAGTGTDIFASDATTQLSALGSAASAGAPQDVTPSRGPDLHPSWLPIVDPGNDIPEAPWTVLLGGSAGLVVVGASLLRRRALGH
jgi:hypothetical protein